MEGGPSPETGPVRIVLATDSLDPSGVGEHMLTLGRELRGAYDVTLACPDRDQAAALLHRAAGEGFDTRPLPVEAEALPDWLQSCEPALLHVHAGIAWEGHDLIRAGRECGLVVIRTEHLPYLLTDERQQAEHLRCAGLVDRTLTVSGASAETYVAAGIPRDRIAVVPNGIHSKPPRRSRADTRRELGLDEQQEVLLTVARFTRQKDHMTLLTALALLVPALPRVRLLLVGTGPCEAEVAAASARGGLRGHILFLGQRDDVPDLLAAADVFVLPSRFEGLPLVILEAMAAGLPVAATRIGGTVEALGEDYPFLAGSGDAEALADAICVLLSDRAAADAAADRCRARFHAAFGARRMGEDVRGIYETFGIAGLPIKESCAHG